MSYLRFSFLLLALYVCGGQTNPAPLDEININFNINENMESGMENMENMESGDSDYIYGGGKKIENNWKSPNVHPPQCGVEQNPEKPTGCGNSRISGGCPAYPHQYPWMIRWDPPGCGGALITDRHVLTAAHCVKDSVRFHLDRVPGNTTLAPVKVKVHDQTDPSDYEEVPVVDAVSHWDVDKPGLLPNDTMAILTLAWPVDLHEKNIGTVCLPPNEDMDYRGETVTAMGWGATHFQSGQSPILKHVKLTVLQKNELFYIYTEVPVLGGVSQDPCSGDSGGPLVHKDVKTGRWTVIGTLWGEGYDCREDVTEDGGGYWNKVTGHLDWIKSVIEK